MQETKEIVELNEFIPVLLEIQRTFNHLPGELYQLVINRNTMADINKLTA